MKQKEQMLLALEGAINGGLDFAEIKENFAASSGAFAQAKQIENYLYVVAYSPEVEGVEVSDNEIERIKFHGVYGYHGHSDWYARVLEKIQANADALPLFAPEFEFVRKNGSGIDHVYVLSNFVDATKDATVFVEFNVLPHLLKGATKQNHAFAELVKALQETKLTTTATCGMHVHFSIAAAANTLETVFDRLTKMRDASEGAITAAQYALWNRSKYYNGATLQGIKSDIVYLKNEAKKNLDAIEVIINKLPLSARKKNEAINAVTATAAKNAIDRMCEGSHSALYHKTNYGTVEFRCAKCTAVQSEYFVVLKNILAFLGLRTLTESERKNNLDRLEKVYEAREVENELPVWKNLFYND